APSQQPAPSPDAIQSGPAASPAPPASAASPAASGLTGRWHFNAAQSEDARQKMRDAGGRHGGFGGGGGGGGWGGGGRGGGGGGRGGGFGGAGFGGRHGGMRGGGDGERPDGDWRENMQAVFEAPEEMTVTQTDSEIDLMEKEGRLRTLHPDGKKYKSEGSK